VNSNWTFLLFQSAGTAFFRPKWLFGADSWIGQAMVSKCLADICFLSASPASCTMRSRTKSRFVFLVLFSILWSNGAFGQQFHEIDIRFAPSYFAQFSSAGVNSSRDSVSRLDNQSALKFDLCYALARDTGRFLRTRVGYMFSDRKGGNVTSPVNFGDFGERIGNILVGFGIGRSFSSKFITIRMGGEYVFSWQYLHATESSGYYLNRQGNQEKRVVTTRYPREVVNSLQLFANLYLKLGQRISAGIEFQQPLNLILIRGNYILTGNTYDSSGVIVTSEQSSEKRHETKLETNIVFSPLLGIRIRL
jgi:hypothetical protein